MSAALNYMSELRPTEGEEVSIHVSCSFDVLSVLSAVMLHCSL